MGFEANPVDKPYYVAYLRKETGWQMPLLSSSPSGDMYYYYNLHDIEKISVVDGLIMVYTPYIEKNIDLSVGDKIYHWFVISLGSYLKRHLQEIGEKFEMLVKYNRKNEYTLDPLLDRFSARVKEKFGSNHPLYLAVSAPS